MPQRLTPLPADLGRWFSTSEARAVGVSPGRLRASDLEVPFRGARILRDRDGATGTDDVADRERRRRELLLVRVRAFATVMPPDAFFFGLTAGAVWGVPLPALRLRGATEPLHVGVFAPRRLLRAAGVRGHQTTRTLTTLRGHDGLLVASPASTWASLGAVLSVAQLVAVGDAFVHEPRQRGGAPGGPGSGLATIAELTAAVYAGRRVGVGRLRDALPRIRVGSMSPGETDLREALVGGGLPEPQLDVDLLDARGRRFGWTEIAYPDWRVLVEYEGDHHRTDREQWYRDVAKHARCRDLGWDPVRVTSADLYPRPEPAVARVRAALVRAGWRP